ncbi:hypothetical protein [Methylomagnum sp.]
MPYPERQQDELCIFKLRLVFAATARLGIAMSGYLCDANGTLIEGADVWRDELRLTATEGEFMGGRLLILPCSTAAFDAATPSADALMARRAFQPRFFPVPGQRDYVLPEIPEAVWRAWLDQAPSRESNPKPGRAIDPDFLFY